ncbi:hypothetical protein [Muricoccus nepalensis]|uniref:hypothetical protein n=1 Tax=Muricoccus nepalensis TaxID=1854500 RepID=UPI00112C4826|nr:hypothetical protein [Roseomonas nepalensis]
MVVCIEVELGLFVRINSEGKWVCPVPILLRDHPDFLDRDSNIECGSPFELDDYVIETSIAKHGVLGCVNNSYAEAICHAVGRSWKARNSDKIAIMKALGFDDLANAVR